MKDCLCWECIKEKGGYQNVADKIGAFFPACKKCHNKRCPHQENHLFKCTQSNEPNQIGELDVSNYTA